MSCSLRREFIAAYAFLFNFNQFQNKKQNFNIVDCRDDLRGERSLRADDSIVERFGVADFVPGAKVHLPDASRSCNGLSRQMPEVWDDACILKTKKQTFNVQ